jgi:hypothetical protein
VNGAIASTTEFSYFFKEVDKSRKCVPIYPSPNWIHLVLLSMQNRTFGPYWQPLTTCVAVVVAADSMRLTPPHSTAALLDRRRCHPMCTATMTDEQAVSMLTAGPAEGARQTDRLTSQPASTSTLFATASVFHQAPRRGNR